MLPCQLCDGRFEDKLGGRYGHGDVLHHDRKQKKKFFTMVRRSDTYSQCLCTWYYTGQPEIHFMTQCHSVADAIALYIESNGTYMPG